MNPLYIKNTSGGDIHNAILWGGQTKFQISFSSFHSFLHIEKLFKKKKARDA